MKSNRERAQCGQDVEGALEAETRTSRTREMKVIRKMSMGELLWRARAEGFLGKRQNRNRIAGAIET